jgi:hypothetical protein
MVGAIGVRHADPRPRNGALGVWLDAGDVLRL